MIENILKNYKRLIVILIVILLFALLYFQFSLFVTYDGTGYYWYISILNGITPFETWDITRGPTLPLLLYIFTKLFGNNPVGILIGFFILYLILITFSFLILKNILDKYHKYNNFLYYMLYIILIIFNPLIIGYSHTLLTEAVAPAIIMLTTFIAFKWKDINWSNSKTKSIIITLAFSLITIFMWFLKQPYMPVILFIITISTCLIGLKNKSWKIFFEKVSTLIITIVMLLLSIIGWNKILNSNGVDTTAKNGNNFFLAKGLIQSLNAYYYEVPKEEYCQINYITNSLLPEEEKEEILKLSNKDINWCTHIKIYNIVRNEEIIGQSSITFNGDFPSTENAINYWLKNTIKNPTLTLYSYYRNYMSIVDLYESKLLSNELGYRPNHKLVLDYSHENYYLGLHVYNNNVNKTWWQDHSEDIWKLENVKYMRNHNFEGIETHNENLSDFIFDISPIYLVLFKILLALALPISLYCFVKFIKNKNNEIYYICTIIFGSAFFHILMHAALGGLIDRYAFPIYPISLLGLVLLLINQKNSVKPVKQEINNNPKILYGLTSNEHSKIQKLVMELKNKDNIETLILNNYLKTEINNIAKEEKISILNFPYQVDFSVAYQTLIKYAYENKYDYVLLLDEAYDFTTEDMQNLVEKVKILKANVILMPRNLNKFEFLKNKIYSIIIKLRFNVKLKNLLTKTIIIDRNIVEFLIENKNISELPIINQINELLKQGYIIKDFNTKCEEK